MICQTVGDRNDKMSSLIIEKMDYPFAQGRWLLVGTGQSTYTFTWGFENTSTSSTTTTL